MRRILRDKDNAEISGVVYPSAVANGNSCVLFIEEVATGEFAALHPNSAEKWLNLNTAGITTSVVSLK
jgi:hypothetical protein